MHRCIFPVAKYVKFWDHFHFWHHSLIVLGGGCECISNEIDHKNDSGVISLRLCSPTCCTSVFEMFLLRLPFSPLLRLLKSPQYSEQFLTLGALIRAKTLCE